MNFRLLFFPLLLIALNLSAQIEPDTMDASEFNIDGLAFTTKKEIILKKYGKPVRIFEPKYECGFLSADWLGIQVFSLDYGSFVFTGDSKEGYLVETIVLKPNLKLKISFRKRKISYQTTLNEFEALFGVKVNETKKVLYHKGGDDAHIFSFSNKRLSKIEYWSPC